MMLLDIYAGQGTFLFAGPHSAAPA